MRILLSLAAAIAILAVALLLLLTPIWTHFALGASGSVAPTPTGRACGPHPDCPDPEWAAIDASDKTVAALVTLGSFDFAAADGSPLYAQDEQAHMRDVQVVLYGFLAVALISLVFVVFTLLRAPRAVARWRAVARGGIWLIVGVIVLGLFAALAFDTVFTLFHEIFFPGGNWAFPADSNLIRLYPEPFWELSSFALGTLTITGGLIVWFVARRRAAGLTAA